MRKEINYEKVQELSAKLVTHKQIARIIGFTPEGFSKRKGRDKRLRDALERGRAEAEISLRTAQFNRALGPNRDGFGGDTSLLIWLDKRFFNGEATLREPPIKTLVE